MITHRDDETVDAVFDAETGFCTAEGWVTVHYTELRYREYTGSRREYIPVGVTLPAGGYIDAPQAPEPGIAICRSHDAKAWEYLPDHRGKTAWKTDSREPFTVTAPGELPTGTTLLAPATAFDHWNGSAWVTDTEAMKAAAMAEASEEKTHLLLQADMTIRILQDAVDLGIATDDEAAQLIAWKRYRVLLSRVDTSSAPDILWPVPPDGP
ncbi:MAG: tail fiber assembly protein [Enterobacteriaceae bacterium]